MTEEQLAAALKAPFPESGLEWRVQSYDKNGKPPKWAMVLVYVDSRAVQERLDAVVGMTGWQTFIRQVDKGVVCELGIYTEDRGWIFKSDGSQNTDIEAVKGGISGAIKRAAVLWGIGRYLYDLEASFVKLKTEKTDNPPVIVDHKKYYWDAPKLPPWALPEGAARVDPMRAPVPSQSTSTPVQQDESPQKNSSEESSAGTEADEIRILIAAWPEESKKIMRTAWKKFGESDPGALVGYAKACNQLVGKDQAAAWVTLSTCDKREELLDHLEGVSALASQMEMF